MRSAKRDTMPGSILAYPVTWGLIGLNLLAFVYTLMQPDPFGGHTLVDLGAVYGPAIGAQGQWWRLVSGMFLHGGWSHVALNMISLYIVGRIAESLSDRWSYLALYMASGIVGGAVSVAMHPDGLSVGASGAIFGVFGMIAGYAVAFRKHLGSRFGVLMREFGGVLALNLVLGFTLPGIDMSAHIGGLVTGWIGGWLLAYRGMTLAWCGVMIFAAIGYVVWWLPMRFATEGLLG
jgi:rhomboid protease GluP